MLIDLSHTVEHGMTTYPGLPAPLICDYLSREASRAKYAAGAEFQIGKIEMVANTGTYLDSPFHRYAEGKDLAALGLEKLAGLDAVVVQVPDAGAAGGSARAIGWSAFEHMEVRGRAVLVATGWDRYWRTDRYGRDNPFLTAEACERLRDAGAALVGIDSVNIDNLDDWARPAHSILLGAEIPIVEHMCNLTGLPRRRLAFYAVPPKVAGFGSFPVRAFVQAE
ncbi:MAG TPA: cyclase family protein [Gemmatimonadales bacterium]|nr:cyclase family protein [Gemmatimonadales bacterium]